MVTKKTKTNKMEEIYENKQIVIKLTSKELKRMLNGEILEGYKVKSIGMVENE